MSKFKHYIINEASYDGNIGFEELVNFYQVADKKQTKEMEEIIKNEDWQSFKVMIKKVIGTKLK